MVSIFHTIVIQLVLVQNMTSVFQRKFKLPKPRFFFFSLFFFQFWGFVQLDVAYSTKPKQTTDLRVVVDCFRGEVHNPERQGYWSGHSARPDYL